MTQGPRVVVMGVSGCGKSEAGERIAQGLRLPLVEGDAFHPATNVDKMRRGIALTDADRAGWLHELRDELARRPEGAVLTCSALKKAYRDILREADANLAFVHLRIPQQEAQERVARRASHFYPASLVTSQFETLEDPAGEPNVFVVDATLPLDEVAGKAIAWLRFDSTFRN